MAEKGEIWQREIVRLLGGNQPIFVAEVRKMNDHYDWQRRYIAVTPSRYYNVKQNWLGHWSIPRDFEIDYIQGIVLHKSTSDFLLKINPQVSGDYRYQGNCGAQLAETLQRLRHHLKMWVTDADIDDYRRMKKQQMAKLDIEAIVQAEYPSTQNSSQAL